jgi:hypothetical protein
MHIKFVCLGYVTEYLLPHLATKLAEYIDAIVGVE